MAGEILGKAGSGTNTRIVGTLYDIMYQINEELINQILKGANDFQRGFGDIGNTINGVIDQIGDLESQVDPIEDSVNDMTGTINPVFEIITIVITAIFGVFIGIGVLAIIATVIMTFCDKFRCRYFLYFICVIFVVLAIVCFLVTLVFSILTPVLYLACDFLNVTTASASGFQSNFG